MAANARGQDLDPHEVLFADLVAHSKKDAAAQEGLVGILCDVLEWEVARNDAAMERAGGRPSRVTVFHGHKPPNISVRAYVERIRSFGGCSACCFVLGLRYVERLQEVDGAYELNSYNMHRLILTGIMVAAKFVDDFYFSNNYWSKVGGIPNDELNGLEMELLFLLNFSLHTTRAEYDDYAAELARRQERQSDLELQRQMGMLNMSAGHASGKHTHALTAARLHPIAQQKVTATC